MARYYPLDTPKKHLFKDEMVDKFPSVTTITGVLDKRALVKWAVNRAINYLTTILEPIKDREEFYGAFWLHVHSALTAHNRESQQAMDYGTFVHWLCEEFLAHQRKPDIPKTYTVKDLDKDEERTIDIDVALTEKFFYGFDYETEKTKQKKHSVGFYEWCDIHNVKPVLTEQKVFGDGYAGRFDLICEMDTFWMDGRWSKKHGRNKDIQRAAVLVDFKTGKDNFYKEMGYQIAAYFKAWKWGTQENPHMPVKHQGVLKFNKDNGKLNYKDYTPDYDKNLAQFMSCRDLFWRENL